VVVEVQGDDGQLFGAVTYIAEGRHDDGKPSLRYITLLREGARAHGLPADYSCSLDSIEHAA
jgi:hypothetical protein